MKPDDLPKMAGERTKRGDIWELGEHRLVVGDSSKAADMARLMGGGKADMVFTDPPYGVAIGDKNKALQSVSTVRRSRRIMISAGSPCSTSAG